MGKSRACTREGRGKSEHDSSFVRKKRDDRRRDQSKSCKAESEERAKRKERAAQNAVCNAKKKSGNKLSRRERSQIMTAYT